MGAEPLIRHNPELEQAEKPTPFSVISDTPLLQAKLSVVENVSKISKKFWSDPNKHEIFGRIDDLEIHKKLVSTMCCTVPVELDGIEAVMPDDQINYVTHKPLVIIRRGEKFGDRAILSKKDDPETELTNLEFWNSNIGKLFIKNQLQEQGDLLFHIVNELEGLKPILVGEQHDNNAHTAMRLFLFGAGGKSMAEAIRQAHIRNSEEKKSTE